MNYVNYYIFFSKFINNTLNVILYKIIIKIHLYLSINF